MFLGEGIDPAGKLHGNQRAGKGYQAGTPKQAELEGGEVAEPDEDFRMPPDGGVIEQRKQPARPVAAPEAEDALDRRVTEHGVKIGGSLGIGPGEEPVAGLQVTSGFDAEAAGFEVADTFFDSAIFEGWAGGGHQPQGVARSQPWGFDGCPAIHGPLLQPQGSR